jgi:hypothetical protein
MLTAKQKKKYSYINKLNQRELYQELIDEEKGTLKYKILKSRIKKLKTTNHKQDYINNLQDEGIKLVDELIKIIRHKRIGKKKKKVEDNRFMEEDDINNDYISNKLSNTIIMNTENENIIIPPYTGMDSGSYAPFN